RSPAPPGPRSGEDRTHRLRRRYRRTGRYIQGQEVGIEVSWLAPVEAGSVVVRCLACCAFLQQGFDALSQARIGLGSCGALQQIGGDAARNSAVRQGFDGAET